jgi:TPR repeat protein
MAKKNILPLHPMFLMGSDLEDQKDFRGAIHAYRKAAKDGDLPSQLNLGNLLDDKIKPARRKEAVSWYKRAIRKGYWPAASSLAIHYRNLGQPRWHLHWLKVAAKLGDTDAPSDIRKLERQLERARARR